MNLALFDFDGTLTDKDSLADFIKFAVGGKKYFLGLVKFLPIFILYKLKIIKNDIAKERLLKQFFFGFDEQKFKSVAKQYSLTKIDLILRDKIYQKLQTHKKQNDRVVIVSASMECWLKDWCEKENIELISTKLEFKNQKFTGKFLTKNCYGDEKVNRIKKYLTLKNYDKIYAYGDSKGDEAMLSLADYKYLIGKK